MTKTREYLKDFLYSLYYFILIYSLILIISHIVLGIGSLYRPLLMIIPFCMGFIISRKAKNFFIFIGLNLLLALSFFLLPLEFLFKVRTVIFAVLMMFFWIGDRIYSNPRAKDDNGGSDFYFRRSGYEGAGRARALGMSHVMAGAALSFAFILIGSGNPILTGQADLASAEAIKYFFVSTTVAMFIITIVQLNMTNLDVSLGLAVSTNVTSVKKITRFNNGIIIGFAVLTTTFIALAVAFHGENIIVYTVQQLVRGIKFMVGLFANETPPDAVVEIVDTEPQQQGAGGGFLPIPDGEPFFLWVLLEKLLFPLTFIVGTVIIIAGLGYAVYSAYKKFYLEKPEEDIKEFVKPDISFKKIRMPRFFSRFTESWSSDNNGKIRKLFYKKIVTHIKRGAVIKNTSTPNEIANTIKNREDISALADMYSKARYSNEAVSDNDAVRVLKRSNN